MLVRTQFPLVTIAMAVAVAVALATGSPARADENLLHGPHPFIKDNELALHVLIASGSGDSMSGGKLAVDYGYKLTGGWIPLWLALALNVQRGGCNQSPSLGACGQNSGDMFETLAGVRWAFATPIPLVPYVGGLGGLAFGFPNGASAGAGLMARAVGGANYFFFDWLGVGAQVGFSIGSLNYDNTFTGSHTYQLFDVGGGLVFQF
jgi:hypothetical protein